MTYVISNECIACGRCFNNCPIKCIAPDGDQYQIAQDRCVGCGTCASNLTEERLSKKEIDMKKHLPCCRLWLWSLVSYRAAAAILPRLLVIVRSRRPPFPQNSLPMCLPNPRRPFRTAPRSPRRRRMKPTCPPARSLTRRSAWKTAMT